MMKRHLLVLILVFSCVEHKFSFIVSPDGSYKVEYKGHGDKNDLTDFDFPLPTSGKWTINSTLENTEAESYDYTAHRLFKRNEYFPTTFYNGDSIYFESLLKHPIKVKHYNWFFRESFSFDVEIGGRNVSSKYPKVEQFILDTENPPMGWLKEALVYLLTETLNQAEMEWNTRPIIAAELLNWKNNELEILSDSTLLEEIDYYKNIGLDIIMQPASPNFYNEMDSIFKSLEDELTITLDLMDDSFSFQLILPGILEYTNSDSSASDTLFWSFELQDYMNENFVMRANSSINYPGRQKAGLFIGFTTILIFWGLRRRKRLR
ncbi:hypothetical protein EB821_00550 [Candidatus Marinimicrobia bacterium PRS2]|nr:hypothetical protein EB821_00550 [Candidatus Marinimicrobia bacterium PRS2]